MPPSHPLQLLAGQLVSLAPVRCTEKTREAKLGKKFLFFLGMCSFFVFVCLQRGSAWRMIACAGFTSSSLLYHVLKLVQMGRKTTRDSIFFFFSVPSFLYWLRHFLSPKFQGRVVYMCICLVPKFSALMFAPFRRCGEHCLVSGFQMKPALFLNSRAITRRICYALQNA